jgi:hypothetical protein
MFTAAALACALMFSVTGGAALMEVVIFDFRKVEISVVMRSLLTAN